MFIDKCVCVVCVCVSEHQNANRNLTCVKHLNESNTFSQK